MRYEVSLQIEYRFAAPTDRARTLLRLIPRDIPGLQRIRGARLTCAPAPHERRDFSDFFGNWVAATGWHAPLSRVDIALGFTATRGDGPGPATGGSPLAPDAPAHFAAPSRRCPADAAIAAFARDAVGPDLPALHRIEALGRALHRAMTFSSGATDVRTPTAEAFAQRKGVCQDYAHILITALRSVGIPAGYVSGFLRTEPPPGKARLAGVDAMHAWVRAWAGPDAGWVEFDPTNDQWAGRDYIVIGYGRDYEDIAPVRGALRGTGPQRTVQRVDVVPLDDAAPDVAGAALSPPSPLR